MPNVEEMYCGISLKHCLSLQQCAIHGIFDRVVISVCLLSLSMLFCIEPSNFPFNLWKLLSSRMLYGKELYSVTRDHVNSHFFLLSSNSGHPLSGCILLRERDAHSPPLSFQRKSGHSCCVLLWAQCCQLLLGKPLHIGSTMERSELPDCNRLYGGYWFSFS